MVIYGLPFYKPRSQNNRIHLQILDFVETFCSPEYNVFFSPCYCPMSLYTNINNSVSLESPVSCHCFRSRPRKTASLLIDITKITVICLFYNYSPSEKFKTAISVLIIQQL